MDIIIQGVKVNSPYNIEKFQLKLDESNHFIVREKLKFERNKLIIYLKALKEEKLIKSIYRPKNKQMQKHLDSICLIKLNMKNSINKIDLIFK